MEDRGRASTCAFVQSECEAAGTAGPDWRAARTAVTAWGGGADTEAPYRPPATHTTHTLQPRGGAGESCDRHSNTTTPHTHTHPTHPHTDTHTHTHTHSHTHSHTHINTHTHTLI